MTEEFALQQGFGQGGAVDRDEAFGGPVAALVDGPGDELPLPVPLSPVIRTVAGTERKLHQGQDVLHDP